MNTRQARQIRQGIAFARQPWRLHDLALIDGSFGKLSPLAVDAYIELTMRDAANRRGDPHAGHPVA